MRKGERIRPFPQNQYFFSESVISEAVRETIWKKVMKDGKSVREVSVELGIEMRRVAAVVRLQEIEKEWIRKVSRLLFNIELGIPDDIIMMSTNSISLEDKYMVKKHTKLNPIPQFIFTKGLFP